MSPELLEALAVVDDLKSKLAQTGRSPEEMDRRRRELTVEAIYHTNRIEGNQLSLPEVREIVEAFWVESNRLEGNSPGVQPNQG